MKAWIAAHRTTIFIAVVCVAALAAVGLLIFRRSGPTTRELVAGNGRVVGHEYYAGTSQHAELYAEAADLQARGDLLSAERIYRRLVELEPQDPSAYIGLAGSQLGQLKFEAARNNYAKALTIDRENPEALYGLGAVCQSEGRRSEARLYYERVLATSADHRLSHYGLAKLAMGTGEFDVARRHAQRFVELAPDSALRTEMSGILRTQTALR